MDARTARRRPVPHDSDYKRLLCHFPEQIKQAGLAFNIHRKRRKHAHDCLRSDKETTSHRALLYLPISWLLFDVVPKRANCRFLKSCTMTAISWRLSQYISQGEM